MAQNLGFDLLLALSTCQIDGPNLLSLKFQRHLSAN